MKIDELHLTIRVRGVVEQEESGIWVAGFPQLEVFSEGESEQEAKGNAKEALELWLESCIERRTLEEALEELGWKRVAPDSPERGNNDVDDAPWTEQIQVPAYQAARFHAPT